MSPAGIATEAIPVPDCTSQTTSASGPVPATTVTVRPSVVRTVCTSYDVEGHAANASAADCSACCAAPSVSKP